MHATSFLRIHALQRFPFLAVRLRTTISPIHQSSETNRCLSASSSGFAAKFKSQTINDEMFPLAGGT